MIDPDHFQKLADAGLTVEQIGVVMRIISEREETYKAADEARKAVARERVQRWRQKRNVTETSQKRNSDATERLVCGDARVEDNLPTKNLAGQKNKNSLGASAPVCDRFEEFWAAYPRREGPNPKKPARDRFNRLVARVDPERLIQAARLLAEEHPTPTRFVPQAITWLNQERFDRDDDPKRGDEFCADDWPNTRFLVIRYRQENRGADPPRAVQGGKAGFLIPADWVEISKQRQAAHG